LSMSGGVIGRALWVAWVGELGGGVGWGLVDWREGLLAEERSGLC